MTNTIELMADRISLLEEMRILTHVQFTLVTPKDSLPYIHATDGQRILKHGRIPDGHLPLEQTLAYRMMHTFGVAPRP